MPTKTKCYVKDCKNYVVFRFPQASRRVWLEIIGRPNDDPKSNNGLCQDHFSAEDFVAESSRGVTLTRKRLRANAVPSLNIPEQASLPKRPKTCLKDLQVNVGGEGEDDLGVAALPIDEDPQIVLNEDPQIVLNENPQIHLNEDPEIFLDQPASCVSSEEPPTDDIIFDKVIFGELNCGSEVVVSSGFDNGTQDNIALVTEKREVAADPLEINVDKVDSAAPKIQVSSKGLSKKRAAKYDIHSFKNEPKAVKYFTGLETYVKFMFVFQSLRTDLFKIKYRDFQVKSLSSENQFFLTLWKLRRNTPDFELGLHFGVSHSTVSNIFISFVLFITEQWSKIDIWPSRSLTDYYMPDSFKKSYSSTRVIIDGTEVPIPKPSNPRYQQATFSTYKNKNTVKVLVGANPCGLISYCSPAFGGSTSDRQIVERSDLKSMCQRGYSIMADRGFNVQDMFASKGRAINIPAFLKGQDHFSGATLMEDRKLASERVHIERLIGFAKSYNILRQEFDRHYVPIASEIFYVCVMLCNFRENIISRTM